MISKAKICQRSVNSYFNFLYRTSLSTDEFRRIMSLKTCYELLNVSETCTNEELKESYLKLVKSFHPDNDANSKDMTEFVEIQNAYNAVIEHRSNSKINAKANDDDSPANYKMIQHRQYLEYNTGIGTPSQRFRQHQQRKVSDAFENVADHHVRKGTSSQDDALVEANRKTKKTMVRNAIDRIVEDLISESMKRGEFDDLPGSGKPQEGRYKSENPYIDIDTFNLNRVLINNGYVPNWVTTERDIRATFENARMQLIARRVEMLTSKDPKVVNWKVGLEEFRVEVRSVNKSVDKFNIAVPSMTQQIFHFDADREIKAISDLSLDESKTILFQQQERKVGPRRELGRPTNFKNRTNDVEPANSKHRRNGTSFAATKVGISFRDVWKEWKALFAGSS